MSGEAYSKTVTISPLFIVYNKTMVSCVSCSGCSSQAFETCMSDYNNIVGACVRACITEGQ